MPPLLKRDLRRTERFVHELESTPTQKNTEKFDPTVDDLAGREEDLNSVGSRRCLYLVPPIHRAYLAVSVIVIDRMMSFSASLATMSMPLPVTSANG